MEIVTVKFQEDILKKIDETIKKNNFNSRTEFIREAVRDKIDELNKELAMQKFLSLYGSGKPINKKTDKQIREEVSKELLAELDKRFK